MKIPRSVEYLAGTDYILRRQREEQELLAANAPEYQEHYLPFDAGYKIGAEVYKDRIVTIIGHHAVLLARISGVDALFGYPSVKD